jgi:hypothetical protein
MMRLFAHTSGLTRLVARYPAARRPEGMERAKQTVRIGAVRYRGCVTVSIGSQGLHLCVRPTLGGCAPVLIPWSEVKGIQETRLYSRRAMQLSVGSPKVGTVTVYEGLFKLMQSHLSQDLLEHPHQRNAA